ncbi:MAG: DMT family transporter, partial [Anaerolineales bacterium]|nr:DMT family transporter [Anaerolineales bacterium]
LAANLLPADFLPGKAQVPAELLWLGQAWQGWLILFLLAAGPTLMGFGLYNVSLSLLPSSIANLIVTTEPVFTITTAYLLLGETLQGIQILGALMIISGVLVLRIYQVWKARNNGKAPQRPAPTARVH